MEEITCIDVAPLKSRILSAEHGLVYIHKLLSPKPADAKCLQQNLTLCRYRWVLKFKVELSVPAPLINISYSYIGDIFIELRHQSFSVWAKVPGKPFDCAFCAYSTPDPPVNPAKTMMRIRDENPDQKMIHSSLSTGIFIMYHFKNRW